MAPNIANYKKDIQDKARRLGINMNLDNPQTIQEKLNWLKLHDSTELKTKCADKIRLHEYSEEKLGKDICIPIIKAYNDIKEINWDELPDQFVIKCNHGSGMNIIVSDKSKLNKSDAVAKLNKWMKTDFAFQNGCELHYHGIEHKIFVEELKSDETQKDSLYDYKFWCFNGEPKFYTINNGHGHGDIIYYTMDDEMMNPYNVKVNDSYRKPKKFDLMVEYAKKLSSDFKFVRVDFYEVGGEVYLGELTFIPGSGFFKYKDKKYDRMFGDYLNLGDTNPVNTKNVNVCIIHYNTPLLTECLVRSINKFTPNSKIYVFDNSDNEPFTYRQNNIIYFDNTKGQIVDFEKELKKYPNRNKSLGKHSKWGSFKHCISVDRCFDLIGDNFILLDSDVLLKKDISEVFDDNYYSCGEIRDWSWNPGKDTFPVHKRIRPMITFINVIKAKGKGIRYFEKEFMAGLYDSISQPFSDEQLNKDSYDTGCWFYEQIQNEPIKEFKCDEYIVHFGGGSYLTKGRNENLTPKMWLDAHKDLWYSENNKYNSINGPARTLPKNTSRMIVKPLYSGYRK